jgi:hypothetical protein
MRSLYRARNPLIQTSSTSTPPQTGNVDETRSANPGRALMTLLVALSAGVTAAWVFVLVALARWLLAGIF